MLRIGGHVSKVPTAEVTQVFDQPDGVGRTRLRSKACPRNKAKHGVPKAKLQSPGLGNPPAAEVATAVRALVIMLDFRQRNGGPVAVTADFAGNPITVFNL